MKTKQVWKFLMVVILLMTTWGIGLVNAFSPDPSVTIDRIRLNAPVDIILGTFDTGSSDFSLVNLDFFAVNERGQRLPIQVEYIQYGDGIYSAGFDYETGVPSDYDIIAVNAIFENESGQTITAHYQGYLDDGDPGDCHEGICVPVGY